MNLQGLSFLVADPNPYFCRIAQGILRGFAAGKVITTLDTTTAIQALTQHKIDILLCDSHLPPDGGLKFVYSVRWDIASEYRTMPILFLTADTRTSTIRRARDSGANMVLAKPISPATIFDRLAWIAFTPRNFVETPTYFGPDRRFKIEGFPNGVGRRREDQQPILVGESDGPNLAQDEIDSLFKAARLGTG